MLGMFQLHLQKPLSPKYRKIRTSKLTLCSIAADLLARPTNGEAKGIVLLLTLARPGQIPIYLNPLTPTVAIWVQL